MDEGTSELPELPDEPTAETVDGVRSDRTPARGVLSPIREGATLKHRTRTDDDGRLLTGVVGVRDGEFVIAWGGGPVEKLDGFDVHPNSLPRKRKKKL